MIPVDSILGKLSLVQAGDPSPVPRPPFRGRVRVCGTHPRPPKLKAFPGGDGGPAIARLQFRLRAIRRGNAARVRVRRCARACVCVACAGGAGEPGRPVGAGPADAGGSPTYELHRGPDRPGARTPNAHTHTRTHTQTHTHRHTHTHIRTHTHRKCSVCAHGLQCVNMRKHA